MKILVTGSNGQLGSELKVLSSKYPQYQFRFTDRNELSIDDAESVLEFVKEYQPSFIINCAAYTAVDKAETERDIAMRINGDAAGYLAAAANAVGARIVHISTDYVFNGTSSDPYNEDDTTDPVNFYGETKLAGERNLVSADPDAIIIRTAWVYSEFGHNFVKTMLRLMKERSVVSVVNDQVGSPTYAADLAAVILQIISSDKWVPGIYNYSNEGRISWFDFATEIRKMAGLSCEVNPVPSSGYPTPAKRPSFSLLNKQKIISEYGVVVPGWKESLQVCLKKLL